MRINRLGDGFKCQLLPCDGLCFSGLVQTYKLQPSKHNETRIWFAKPFDIAILRP